MKVAVILLVTTSLLGACAVNIERPSEASIASAKEQRDYDNAEKSLASGKFADSLILFKEFQNLHPQSRYRQSARMGEAKSLEGLSQWDEAVKIYNDVYLKTVKYQKDIAALAMYNLSFCYEALGDDAKAISSLLDAKKMGSELKPEVALAEIPARLAMLYGKFDRQESARQYFIEAEMGIKKVTESKKDSLNKEWIIKTYYQMGTISTNQLSVDSFSQVVQGQKYAQIYLIRALEYPDSPWAIRALTQLKETYQNMLNTLKNVGADSGGALARQEIQNSLGSDLTDLVNQAELYRPLAEDKMNPLQVDFFGFLKIVLTQTEQILYSGKETMGLTPESEKLNSINRVLPARKKSPISLPPKEAPAKVVPKEDPNL